MDIKTKIKCWKYLSKEICFLSQDGVGDSRWGKVQLYDDRKIQ